MREGKNAIYRSHVMSLQDFFPHQTSQNCIIFLSKQNCHILWFSDVLTGCRKRPAAWNVLMPFSSNSQFNFVFDFCSNKNLYNIFQCYIILPLPAIVDLLKINNKNIRIMSEKRSKLTIKTPEGVNTSWNNFHIQLH